MVCATTVLLAALLACAVASPLPKTTRDGDVNNYRLPKAFIPDSYKLHIKPDYNGGSSLVGIEKFDGTVNIHGKIDVKEEAVREIVLHHADEITIDAICVVESPEPNENAGFEVMVCANQENKINIKEMNRAEDYNNTTEKLTIQFTPPISEDKDVIVIVEYQSPFVDRLTGFYYSTYEHQSEERETKTAGLLATKFEPTHARKAFPCLDEPSLKAKFTLKIDIQSGINAIANTEANESESKENEYVTFIESPTMTTYLLAFIVYEEDSFGSTADTSSSSEARDDTKPDHNTWARKAAIDDGDGALSERDGPEMIQFMDDYTGINYTEYLSKMDQVALPDFQSGAMENWGLVTYRESALLYNKASGTTAAHKRISDVLAHEIVHQWFGNLVVTNWWDSVWLNEGFANYFELLIMSSMYETWRMEERFLLDEQMSVFSLDSSSDAVPLTKLDVFSPDEIGNHFGSTSYSKGGAILRQISNVMSEEKFKEACISYLTEYAENSATADQLLEEFVKANDESKSGLTNTELKKALESWTLLKGYPVITVKREGTSDFKITQERFLQTEETEVDEMPTYYVPLTWTISNETVPTGPKSPQAWLTEKQTVRKITINGIDENQWVIFNSWQSGYYRVNYDDEMWNKIIDALKTNPETLAPVDRAAVIDNLLNFARANRVSYERALTGIEFLKDDIDFIPWAAARTALAHLDRMLSLDADYKRFIRSIVDNVYKEFQWTTEDTAADFEEPNVNLTHRINVFSIACAAGHSDCLSNAENMLNGELEKIDNELQSVVYCYGLKNDQSNALWNKLWAEWQSAGNNAARRGLLTTALGCTKNETTLKTYLGYSLDSTVVRSQDAYTVFTAVYSNPDGVNAALDFLDDEGYDALEDAYKSVRNVMSTIISGLASRLTTETQKKKLTDALAGKVDAHGTALQTVDGNIMWVQKFSGDVKAVTGGAQANVFATSIILLCAAVLTFLK